MRAVFILLMFCSWGIQAQDAIGPDGSRYWGPMRDGAPNGYGRLVAPDGSVYTGEFRAGLFHGRGTILLRNGQVIEGLFVEGHLPGRTAPARGATPDVDAERREAALAVEMALLRQRPLLDAALASLAPREPGRINLYAVAVGGDGTQDVFRREAEFVRGSLDHVFGTRSRSLVLANGLADRAPMATVASLREALQAVAARMDREQDILFLYLTSHGTSDHELVLGQGGMMLRSLRAADLAAMLRESGIRWKVVVLSACYAGGFLDALRDEGTLAIAAARRDRQSFGCTAQAELTWFGHAFAREALPGAASFQDAYRRALPLVAERETRERIPDGERSLPQMQEPRPIAEQLARWWSQSRR
jgi:hypothetical protein